MIGPDVIDIRKLYAQADVFTYDPGFTSTASCESAITFIDGDKGELLHRGYPIEQLAKQSTHIELCYLLLYGELPTADQLADFETRVTRHTMVHEQLHNFFRGFRRDSHPMATMVGVVGAMSAFYHDSLDINDDCANERWPRSVMIAKLPTIAAMAYKYSVGQPFVYPKQFFVIMRATSCICVSAVPAEDYVVNPDLGTRDGPHHDAARRSRTKRLHLNGATGGRLRGQILLRASRRGLRVFGVRHMAAQTKPVLKCCKRNWITVDRIPEYIAKRQRQETIRFSPNGLWPPRL